MQQAYDMFMEQQHEAETPVALSKPASSSSVRLQRKQPPKALSKPAGRSSGAMGMCIFPQGVLATDIVYQLDIIEKCSTIHHSNFQNRLVPSHPLLCQGFNLQEMRKYFCEMIQFLFIGKLSQGKLPKKMLSFFHVVDDDGKINTDNIMSKRTILINERIKDFNNIITMTLKMLLIPRDKSIWSGPTNSLIISF